MQNIIAVSVKKTKVTIRFLSFFLISHMID